VTGSDLGGGVGDAPEDESLLYVGEFISIRAITRLSGASPAKDWLDGLDKTGKAKFYSAAKILENSIRSNRPPSGRAEKIVGSRTGLWELKVTPAGGSPPHLRLLYVREGQVLWAATGFKKQSNKLRAQDIRQGETIVNEWKGGQA
jgi:hypothetical protein